MRFAYWPAGFILIEEGSGLPGGEEGSGLGRVSARSGKTGVLRRSISRKSSTYSITKDLGLTATESYVLARLRTETLPGGATVIGVTGDQSRRYC